MHHDNLHTGEEARTKLISGIKKVANAVGSTMGTGGANAILEAIETPGHLMTNDGFSIANSIYLADPIEEMGRKILVESINRANKASGDGSSTTCVLTASIIEEGMKHLATASPMDIKRSLEECVPLIEASLKEQTRQLVSDGVLNYTLLEQVATVSSEDPEIGKTIAGIYTEIGPTGIIHWDISKTAEDAHTIGSGITVEGAGYYSPYMCDATEGGQSSNQIRLKNPRILITKQKISSAAEFNTLGAALNGQDVKDLVVFCDEIDPLVVPDLVKTRMVRGFRFILVKMPTIFKDVWFEDLALATGATVINNAAGLPMKEALLSHLGTVDNVLITKEDTFLDGIKDVSDHIAELDKLGDDNSKLRASRLNTKTARYFVGAQSDSALSYRRLKVEDAISAAWQALNGGVVAGGGMALTRAASEMPTGMESGTVGGQILQEALLSPARRIVANAGISPDHAVPFEHGYDTRTKRLVNMFDAGIIDPTNVVLNAVKNAVSVAAAVLTANTVVTLPRDDQPQQAAYPLVR